MEKRALCVGATTTATERRSHVPRTRGYPSDGEEGAQSAEAEAQRHRGTEDVERPGGHSKAGFYPAG